MDFRSEPGSELNRFQLPVSGRRVTLRSPCGAEDLLLVEAPRTPGGDASLALALADRLIGAVDGEPLDWRSLTVTDLDVVVLRLRQALIGDTVQADHPCPSAACGQRIDIEFSITDFLAHQAPATDDVENTAPVLEPDDEPGWFRLSVWAEEQPPGAVATRPIRFRLPTVDDLLAAAGDAVDESILVRRCMSPPDLSAPLRHQVESAMEGLAPSLSCELQGVCPECGSLVAVQFDARWFCLRELRERAAFIYQDIDILARRYHWSEGEILSMPHVRRAAYAEFARQAEGA